MKIAVPLIAGFKAAAMVVSSLVVLKGLLLKSFAFSSLALAVSMGIAFKYLYDKVQGPLGLGGHGYDTSSIYNSYAPSWGGGSDNVWQGSSAVELQPGGFQGVPSGHDAYSLTSGGDLQGHFSEHIQKIANTSRLPFGEQSSYQQPYQSASSISLTSTQYQPAQNQYQPAQSQYQSAQSQYQTAQSQYQPSQSQFQPTQAQYQPTQAQYQPTQAQYSQTQAQYSLQHGQRNL